MYLYKCYIQLQQKKLYIPIIYYYINLIITTKYLQLYLTTNKKKPKNKTKKKIFYVRTHLIRKEKMKMKNHKCN